MPDGTVRAFGQCLTAELTAPTHPPPFDVFAAPMANGSQAVVLFNRGGAAATGTLDIRAVFRSHGPAVKAAVKDLWAGAFVGTATSTYTAL